MFWALFGRATLAQPVQRSLRELDEVVAGAAGVELGLFDSTVWQQLQCYVLEIVAIWSTARVAGVRASGGEHSRTYVYLLRRGEQLLGAADPVATLRSWLPAEPSLR